MKLKENDCKNILVNLMKVEPLRFLNHTFFNLSTPQLLDITYYSFIDKFKFYVILKEMLDTLD
jgi:hypothetical protein